MSSSTPSASILTPIPISRTRTRPKTTYRARRRFTTSFPPIIIQRPKVTPESLPIDIDEREKNRNNKNQINTRKYFRSILWLANQPK